jgi:hypothetical protein
LQREGLDTSINKLKPTEWVLVHGVMNDANGSFGHAWLENGDTVYDPLKRVYGLKADYHRTNRVTVTIQYNFPLALKLVLELNTYGHWNNRIAAAQHCPREE